MFHPSLPIGPKEVESQAVGLGIHQRQQLSAKGNPEGGFEQALQDRELEPAGHGLRRASQPGAACDGQPPSASRRHKLPGPSCRLFPEERRVSVEVPAQVPSQQEGLGIRQETQRNSFVEERMEDLLLLPGLPGYQDLFAGSITHDDATGLRAYKAVPRDLAAIDEGNGEAVGEHRTQFFHQVERKAGTARAVAMQKTHRGVEPDGFQRGRKIVSQHDVQNDNNAFMLSIGGRRLRSRKKKSVFLMEDQLVEDAEIYPGRVALHAA